MPEITSNYPIIKIKLCRPSVGSDFIPPPRLFSKLDTDSKCCLTQVLAQPCDEHQPSSFCKWLDSRSLFFSFMLVLILLLSTPLPAWTQEPANVDLSMAGETWPADYSRAVATQMEWPTLKSIINKGLNILTKEEKARIANKYVPVQVEYGIRSADVFKLIFVACGIAVLLLLLFQLKSKQLLLTLTLIELVCIVALIISGGFVLQKQNVVSNRLARAINTRQESFTLADQLRQSSDDLTRMVRTYVVTGDSIFEEYFHTILNIRDGKVPRPENYDQIFWDFKMAEQAIPINADGEKISLISLMRRTGFQDEEFKLLAKAKRRSDKLVELEEIAFNAMKGKFADDQGTFTIIKRPDRDLALRIVFSKEYHQAKTDIMKPINDFFIAIDNRTSNALATVQNERRLLFSIFFYLVFCLSIVLPLFILTGYRYYKKNYDELSDSENLFRSTFEQVAVGIAHVSPEGHFLRINDRFCEIVGYTNDKILALTFQDITHPADRDSDAEYVRLLLSGESDCYSMEKRYIRNDGETVWVNLTVSLLRDDGGGPRWFVSVVEEITERKLAEESSRKAEQKFKDFMMSANEGFVLYDKKLNLVEINDKALEIFPPELTKENLSGKNILEIVPSLRETGRYDKYVAAIKTGEPLYLDNVTADPIFGDRHLSIKTFKVGEGLGMIFSDITERKKAEKDLKNYQVRLKALASQLTLAEENERSRLATELHDHIGQTLAFSRIQVAKARKYTTEKKLTAILDEISQSLLQNIQDTKELVFDLSSPLLNEIGLAAAINNWLEERVWKKHNIEIEFINEDRKFSLTNDLNAILFRNVRELLFNVIRHAKATEVLVKIENQGAESKITIQDNGVGFDPDEIITNVNPEKKSFGIFSVKERMDDIGGSLRIISKPDEGCKAILSLPIESEEGNQ